MDSIRWVGNHLPKTEDPYCSIMKQEHVKKAMAFHQSFPQYAPTPLASLPAMAGYLGVKGIYVKDESYRFGLNAFKVLGGSFSMACYIAKELGKDVGDITYDYLTSDEFLRDFGQATFFTATDGNHGRGVAWAARQLKQKAVVHMPKNSAKSHFDNIAGEGAKVTIEDVNYDECVRMAAREALEARKGIVIQDTAWEGYEEVPAWIMQGYGTMALEADTQLKEAGAGRPTHIFVQAGVGSLAGAVQGYFSNLYPDDCPSTAILEAEAAACLYKSACADDGDPRYVTGDLGTIMAGLACGEPNTLAWDILKNHASFFLSCPDCLARSGMRLLGAPLKGDPRVISGESGAIGMGVLKAVMTDSRYKDLRESMGLTEDSVILMFSTEGDTDPVNYRKIVWGNE